MRASYDSIDNKQKMCEKVNKDITFIQFFHSTRLHFTELFKIFFSLLTLQLLFCKKLVGREKMKSKERDKSILEYVQNYYVCTIMYTHIRSQASDWNCCVKRLFVCTQQREREREREREGERKGQKETKRQRD